MCSSDGLPTEDGVTDPDGRIDLAFSSEDYIRGDGEASGSIRDLYLEKQKIHVDLIVRENEESRNEEVILEKKEDAEALLDVPETAKLVELSWYWSAMSYSDSFSFELWAEDEGGTFLTYSYADSEDGSEHTSGEEGIPVPEERMEELTSFLRGAKFIPYSDPDPYLLDAPMSRLDITWEEAGLTFTNVCGEGGDTGRLHELLTGIAEEALTEQEKDTSGD